MFRAFTTKSCKNRPIKFHCLLLIFPSVYTLLNNKRKTAIQNRVKVDNERDCNMCLPVAVSVVQGLKERNMYVNFILLLIRVWKISESEYWHRYICPSVRMEQLCFRRKNLNEIWYLSFYSEKCVQKRQVSIKSDNKNNKYFYVKVYVHLW